MLTRKYFHNEHLRNRTHGDESVANETLREQSVRGDVGSLSPGTAVRQPFLDHLTLLPPPGL